MQIYRICYSIPHVHKKFCSSSYCSRLGFIASHQSKRTRTECSLNMHRLRQKMLEINYGWLIRFIWWTKSDPYYGERGRDILSPRTLPHFKKLFHDYQLFRCGFRLCPNSLMFFYNDLLLVLENKVDIPNSVPMGMTFTSQFQWMIHHLLRERLSHFDSSVIVGGKRRKERQPRIKGTGSIVSISHLEMSVKVQWSWSPLTHEA